MKWLAGALGLCMPMAAWSAGYECLIEPAQVVEVRSAVEGLVDKVHVRRADRVRKGQVLLELESRAQKVAVEGARHRASMQGPQESAQNRIDFAAKKLARTEAMMQENFVSGQARDEADTELRLAQSELKAARENKELARIEHAQAVEQLALRTITSPFDGVVVDRMVNPGELAETGNGRRPLLKLAQIDVLRVDAILPAAMFGKVRIGQRATVMPQVLGGRYAAFIKAVDRVVDAASATFVARIELPNREGAIPSGVRCLVEVQDVQGPPDTR